MYLVTRYLAPSVVHRDLLLAPHKKVDVITLASLCKIPLLDHIYLISEGIIYFYICYHGNTG